MMVPGYRAKWRECYACMTAELSALVPNLTFGEDGGAPWIELRKQGLRLFGFWTEPANSQVYDLLKDVLPEGLPKTHFRLAKDCLNRYVYPHMRPDLKPAGFPVERMFGFHAQHKDAIVDLKDAPARPELFAALRPKADDVIVDCGSFLGFGELRLAPEMPDGHIYAVEADSECHALLERNLAYNKIGNVTALHRAVWNEETELELETGFAQANTLIREIHKGQSTQKVRTVTIDQIIDAFGLAKVDMLSLTLNGAEVEALAGARRTLDELRPRIRLAGWYARNGRPVHELVRPNLEAHRYRVCVGLRGNVMALPEERT